MELRPAVLFLVWTYLSILFTELTGHKVYTNTWAVQIPGGPSVADGICNKHGFINHGQIFGDYYHFQHRAVMKRSLTPHRGRHFLLDREPQAFNKVCSIVDQRKFSQRSFVPPSRYMFQSKTNENL